MALIPDDTIRRVRDSVDIKHVVETVLGVELKREGANWKCNCPFHEEKTPSFVVFSASQRFQCMGGCAGGGRGGDVIEFVMRKEEIPFRAALERVAAMGGIELPKQAPGTAGRDPVSRARAAAEWAARYWEGRLWSADGTDALTYLRDRGLTDDTIKRFRVGVVADSYRDLHPKLERAGYSRAEAKDAGVAAPSANGQGFFDRFKGRIVFPVATSSGHVIGFGARVVPGSDPAATPKYVNGPETLLYKKSTALFGLQLARDAIRRHGRAVIVEGYVDTMAAHQAGITGAVAACGTALTAEHLAGLRSVGAKSVTLLFDGDVAGERATTTVAPRVFESGLSAYVALLPDGLDPDELVVKSGSAALASLVEGAVPLSEYLVGRAVSKRCGDAVATAPLEAKSAVLADLRPCLVAADPLTKALLETQIASKLGIPVSSLRRNEELDTRRMMEAEAIVAALAGLGVPAGVGEPVGSELLALVERARGLVGTTPRQEGAVRRLLVVENDSDARAYLDGHRGGEQETQVFVLAGNAAELRGAAERLSRLAPIVVVSAFSNTVEGARLAGLVEQQVQGLAGVTAQRAAPPRVGHGWGGPTESARAMALGR